MSERISVCVCTFRRASLAMTLDSLAQQRLERGQSLEVIVADNDCDDRRRREIEGEGSRLGLSLTYVHAPACNISVARNACLEAATTDWIAFVDDDEVARPDWLMHLLAAREGHEVVFGIAQARYDAATPDWIRQGDFHSNRLEGNDEPWNGYTANVAIDRRFVTATGLRFSEALGQVGGEDTLFFFEAHARGARFAYAPTAVVDEPVPAHRARLRWLILRRFRAGQVHHLLLQRRKTAVSGSLAAAGKAFVCLTLALLGARRPVVAARRLLRGALHLGVVARAFGMAPYREYAKPS